MIKTDQIHLPLNLSSKASFENFFSEGNEAIVSLLSKNAEEPSNKVVYLHGPRGSGKTHLLSASCQKDTGLVNRPVYVSLQLDHISPEILSELDPTGLVCIDDVELASGDQSWERALLNLYESFAFSSGRLLIASLYPPGEVGFNLPDLATRFASGGVWSIRRLTETQLPKAISFWAIKGGLEMPESVISYLMRRIKRDPVTIFSMLDYIDRQSISHQRRVTVPFIREVTQHLQK